jgi:hypothetical protein
VRLKRRIPNAECEGKELTKLNRMSKLVTVLVSIVGMALFGYFVIVELPHTLDGTSPADFPNYYFAGRRLFEARPVYADLKAEVQATLGWDYDVYPADPPPTIVLLAPLACVDYVTAWWILATFSIVVMIYVSYMVAREVGFSKSVALMCCAVALGSSPFLFLLKRNHMESILLLLGFAGWYALRRQRYALAGCCWGAAGALKLFPSVWFVATSRSFPARLFQTACLVFGTMTLVGILIVGKDNTQMFVTRVLPLSARWYGSVGNYSIVSLSVALFPTAMGMYIGYMCAALLCVVMLRPHLYERLGADCVWITSTAVALLISPLSWRNYLILTLPCLIILAKKMDFGDRDQRLLFGGLFICFWNWPELIPTGDYTLTVLLSSMPTFGLVALYYAALRYANGRCDTPVSHVRLTQAKT